MQCGTCGSQDTTIKRGMSKKTGQPWTAYDCNEPQCKNEKGYPSRTFVPTPRKAGASPTPVVSGTLEKKVDQILAILKANFKTEITREEISSLPEQEDSPF